LKELYHENIILMLDSFETAHEFCVVTEVSIQLTLVCLRRSIWNFRRR